MLVSPTGTGYVNYVATAATQYMTRGDMATVTLQYSKRPSPLSLGKIGDAKEQNRLLWLRILERVRAHGAGEAARRSSSSASRSARTPARRRSRAGAPSVPRRSASTAALWIGTPAAQRVAARDRSGPTAVDVDQGIVAVVNDYEQFLALGEEAQGDACATCLLSHDNDGVTKFEASPAQPAPAWLGPDRPADAGGARALAARHPGLDALASGHDLLPAARRHEERADPRAYRAWAHDYRPDLPDFIRDVYDLDCSDEQLERIKVACEQREEFREAVFK